MEISVSIAGNDDRDLWNVFATKHCNHHSFDFRWQKIISGTFGHSPIYLIAKDGNNNTTGVAPLFFVNSYLFGKALISVPYLNGGGISATDDKSYLAIFQEIEQLTKAKGATYTELRHIDKPIPEPDGSVTRTHKVSMLLNLESDPEKVFSTFSAKLRSQIKRPEKSGATAIVLSGNDASPALVDDFYQVFSRNMRDLGTPVYPKKLFANTLDQFGEQARISIVYLDKRPIAAGITLDWNGITEIPWASSLRDFNKISPNMLLYWSLIESAAQRGMKSFDFGRSSPDSGPYKFKQQWGAVPRTLNWLYPKGSELPDVDPSSSKFSLMVSTWKHLPLFVTKIIGPFITRSLP